MALTDEQKAELVDPDDGENRAVRYFLMMYGGQTCTIEGMRKHLQLSGFPYWPEWAERDGHMTKGGAQAWIRYLIGLESALSAQPAPCGEYVAVRADAVEWLKNHYPALCEKSGMCERVAGRLYTRTTLSAQPAKPAITDERVVELAKEAGALKASDIYDNESLVVDAGDLIRFAALLAAEGNKPATTDEDECPDCGKEKGTLCEQGRCMK